MYSGRVGYGPSWLWAEFVWAELVMGRVCHGPSLLWAEMSSYHWNDPIVLLSEMSIYSPQTDQTGVLTFGLLY